MLPISTSEREILTSSVQEWDYGVDLLDVDGNLVEDISADVLSMQVTYDIHADIHGDCQLELVRDLTWGSDRIRPWVAVSRSQLVTITEETIVRPAVQVSRTWDDAADWATGTGVDVDGSTGVLRLTSTPSTTSQTFTYTGAEQTWQVPAGVTSVTVEAWGAQGGMSSGAGGQGGYTKATIPVTPGETLRVNVGGQGQPNQRYTAVWDGTYQQGGFNGGGAGGRGYNGVEGQSGEQRMGAGGGGASDVRRGGSALSNRVIVAGGGGAGGWMGGTSGGAGGGLTGATAATTPQTLTPGGAGGTQSTGGAGGDGNYDGSPGSSGQGGQGALAVAPGINPGAAGGGGGGYYGGGGGASANGYAEAAGGGGGSSYTDAGATSVTMQQGGRTGNGQVVISYVVSTYSASGTWTSPVLDLATLEAVSSSLVDWQATTPVGTTVAVETSVDNGATWQAATDGGPIAGVTPDGAARVRVTLTSNGAATPEVSWLTLMAEQSEILHVDTLRRIEPETYRFNLGVFIPTSPETEAGEDPRTRRVQAYDMLWLLQREIGDTYVVQTGTSYLDAIRTVLSDAGVTATLLLQGDRQSTTLAEPAVWVLGGGYTWLDVINDLLGLIGYEPMWADSEGRLRSAPYQLPADRGTSWVFDSSDLLRSIMAEQRRLSADVFDAPNLWRFVRNKDQALTSDDVYVVDRTAGLPTFQIRPKTVYVDAADHDALVAEGDRIVTEDTSTARVVEFDLTPLPFEHGDVVEVHDADLGLSARCVVASYTASPGTSHVTLEVL